MRDVDKTAGAGAARAHLGGVDIALAVQLAHAHVGHVDASAVVVVKLLGMAHHGKKVLTNAKVNAAQLNAAVNTALDSNHDLIREAFLGTDAANHVVGDAGAQIDHAAGVELLAATASDELALVKGRGLDGGHRHTELAHVRGVEINRRRHAVVFFWVGAHHNLVDKDTGDRHVLGIDGARLGDLANLRHDLAAVAFGGENRIEDLELHGLVGRSEIAHLVADGAANKADVNGDLVIEHVFFAVNLDNLGDVGQGLGALIHLAAFDARVDEGAQAHLAHLAGKAAGHRAIELGNLTLRHAVGLDLVVGNHVHPLGLQTPVRADNAGDQALVGQVLDATLAIGLAAGVKQRQVAGVTRLKKTLLDGLKVGLRGRD